MSALAIVSLISLLGWLALNIGALRDRGVSAPKALRLGLAWVAIFSAVAFLFSRIG